MKTLAIICATLVVGFLILIVVTGWMDVLNIHRNKPWKVWLDNLLSKSLYVHFVLLILFFVFFGQHMKQVEDSKPVITETYELTYADLTKDTVSYIGKNIDVSIHSYSKFGGESNLRVIIDKKEQLVPFVIMYKKL